MEFFWSDIQDGMRREFNVDIMMDDGVPMRADVFRPIDDGKYPVILTYGPYAKGLHFEDGYAYAWNNMVTDYPDALAGTSNLYQSWEVVDPEKWVPDGYVCLRVDSRGTGCSPGYVDHFSPRETQDLIQCIDWAAKQPWSNGKVGMNGISYYAMNAWIVAAQNPPGLEAICIWEGCSDWYRDGSRHGGILSIFWAEWYDRQVKSVQYGLGNRGRKSRVTGQNISGEVTMDDAELAQNRCNLGDELVNRKLDEQYYRDRSAKYEDIRVPLLSCGNWCGDGLHIRGNFEGYLFAGTDQKWLEAHGGNHWAPFYTDYGTELQKKFFGHFLKGEGTGWDKQERVQLQIRRPGQKFQQFELRMENEWPLARTQYTKYYLTPDYMLAPGQPTAGKSLTYEAMGGGLTFLTEPFEQDMEITGHAAAKLFLSSDTVDADLFLALRLFTPDLKEVTFEGAVDSNMALSLGWLRVSQRKLDEKRSTEWRPYHTHDERQPLTPGQVYEADVEMMPTCIVVPKGYRLGLSVRGKDYEVANRPLPYGPWNNWSGTGFFRHTEARDRVPEIFHNNVTLHFDEKNAPYILLPVIPE